jgi:hypothetical protein
MWEPPTVNLALAVGGSHSVFNNKSILFIHVFLKLVGYKAGLTVM